MHSRKVVLVSHVGYSGARDDALLRELIERKVELFCAVGVDAALWEDAMDWLCIGQDGKRVHHVITTAHPDESLEEVVDFAERFSLDVHATVEVIHVR